MPIYEYVCSGCDLTFELMRPFSESDKEASCPRCHNKAKRIMSPCASFSKSSDGEITSVSGTGGPCAGCSATTCDTCSL